jgi:hypothetical protein
MENFPILTVETGVGKAVLRRMNFHVYFRSKIAKNKADFSRAQVKFSPYLLWVISTFAGHTVWGAARFIVFILVLGSN